MDAPSIIAAVLGGSGGALIHNFFRAWRTRREPAKEPFLNGQLDRVRAQVIELRESHLENVQRLRRLEGRMDDLDRWRESLDSDSLP